MEFGLHFASTTFPERERSVQCCQEAELAGVSFAVAVEHVVLPTDYESVYPYSPTGKLPVDLITNLPDPLVWMTHVAACTQRLRFMTGVLILPQRNPLVLAKQIATMDYLSGGRIELGIGVGWLREELRLLVCLSNAADSARMSILGLCAASGPMIMQAIKENL